MIAHAILLVESDRSFAGALVEQLRADGYRIELAQSAEHARAIARRQSPELIMLGDLQADRGALKLLEEIRAGAPPIGSLAKVPVIVLGARADELDVLRAFDAGADDFIARPTCYLVLRARLRALLRRTEEIPPRRLVAGPLEVDLERRTTGLHGASVDLRRMEFELLAHLAAHPDRVFAKQDLLRDVWGYRSAGSTRTVDSHASRLRRKLQRRDRARWVINVRGVGYRLR